MKKKHLVELYLSHIGMRLVEGESVLPILPFFMLDCMLGLFDKDIRNFPCKQRMKQVKNQWRMSYNALNRDFFSVFSEDETDEVIDLMDSFCDYIQNDLMITKVSVMNVLPPEIPFDVRSVISSACICNILAQSAQIVYKNVYKNGHGEDMCPLEICRIEKMSSEWMGLLFRQYSSKDINLSAQSTIIQSVDALCKKMIGWLHTQN